MRIRRDTAFISGVLFTIALLAFFRESLIEASTWRKETIEIVEGFLFIENYRALLGLACLTIFSVGLIVVWSGYVQRARWAWLAMCVIVWIFMFPMFMLPVWRRLPINVSDWFREALTENGPSRYHAKATIVFLLMVVALLLPVKSFFFKRSAQEAADR